MKLKQISLEEAQALWEMEVKVYVHWRGEKTGLSSKKMGGGAPTSKWWWHNRNKAPRFWVGAE